MTHLNIFFSSLEGFCDRSFITEKDGITNFEEYLHVISYFVRNRHKLPPQRPYGCLPVCIYSYTTVFEWMK
ncbi:hypothetical protein KGM_201403A, partial [Danaus plexippus plexippus]